MMKILDDEVWCRINKAISKSGEVKLEGKVSFCCGNNDKEQQQQQITPADVNTIKEESNCCLNGEPALAAPEETTTLADKPDESEDGKQRLDSQVNKIYSGVS